MSGKQLETYTIPNNSFIKTENGAFREQNVGWITEKAIGLVSHIANNFTRLRAIGVTGQMHGILYTDGDGNACSELMNWQDTRAALKDYSDGSGRTYCAVLGALTGEHISAGYGFATHYYNRENGLVPANAYSFCSIMDYSVMKLTGHRVPLMHSSVAAGYGFFDIRNKDFMRDKLCRAGLDDLKLPEVTDSYTVAGRFGNIPASVAIGDNQASFLGSFSAPGKSILVNVGTGSQICAQVSYRETADGNTELRPHVGDDCLLSDCALCGGRSYTILEKFFADYTCAAGGVRASQYEYMNRIAKEAYEHGERRLDVDTRFCGTRSGPGLTGSITGITDTDFTPDALILGVIYGICRELRQFVQP